MSPSPATAATSQQDRKDVRSAASSDDGGSIKSAEALGKFDKPFTRHFERQGTGRAFWKDGGNVSDASSLPANSDAETNGTTVAAPVGEKVKEEDKKKREPPKGVTFSVNSFEGSGDSGGGGGGDGGGGSSSISSSGAAYSTPSVEKETSARESSATTYAPSSQSAVATTSSPSPSPPEQAASGSPAALSFDERLEQVLSGAGLIISDDDDDLGDSSGFGSDLSDLSDSDIDDLLP